MANARFRNLLLAAGVLLTGADQVRAEAAASPKSSTTQASAAPPDNARNTRAAEAATRASLTVEVKLPGAVDDMLVAGGGHYLVLTMLSANKVLVFDVESQKIIGTIPLGSADAKVAAGQHSIVIALPDAQTLERWDLATCKREMTTPSPYSGMIRAVAMGSGSEGPVLVQWTRNTPSRAFEQAHVDFIDLKTLAPAAIGVSKDRNANSYWLGMTSAEWRASADGLTFVSWRTHTSPTGLSIYTIASGAAHATYIHESVGYAAVSTDGSAVYTSSGLIYDNKLQPRSPNRQPCGLLPAAEPGYYFSAPMLPLYFMDNRKPEHGSVFLQGAGMVVAKLPLTPELAPPRQNNTIDYNKPTVSPDKRLVFVPSRGVLIGLPQANDRLVLHKFNLAEELDKSGNDYLFVTSEPPSAYTPGQEFTYQIKAMSKRGGVTYRLDRAPRGMTITPEGKITWAPSRGYLNTNLTVAVTLHDKSDREFVHSFGLALNLR